MNWDDIRYFLAVYRKESFVSAAAELKVTHTTVARRLSALEASLGTLLFQRTQKGCRITPAGEALSLYAENLETIIMNLQEEVSGKNQQLSGPVRIGTPDGIGNAYLAARLSTFQNLHPALEVQLIPVPMYYSLSKREIDILITVKQPRTGNFIARKLTGYKLGLFATQAYLKTQNKIDSRHDLTEHQFVSYIDELLFDEDLDFLGEFHPDVRPTFRTSTVVAQMNAVLAGSGIGVIPYFMANGEHTLIPVLPALNIERSYWLQVNPDSKGIARVRTTIDYIVRQIRKEKDLFYSLNKDQIQDEQA